MDGTLAVQIVWVRQKSLSEENELELVLKDDELFQSGSLGKLLERKTRQNCLQRAGGQCLQWLEQGDIRGPASAWTV